MCLNLKDLFLSGLSLLHGGSLGSSLGGGLGLLGVSFLGGRLSGRLWGGLGSGLGNCLLSSRLSSGLGSRRGGGRGSRGLGVPHRRPPALELSLPLLLGLLHARGEELGVLGGFLLVLGEAGALQGTLMSLALEHCRGDKSLDLRGLGNGLLGFGVLLGRQGPPDNILADIILLGQVEELADLGGSLRPKATGNSFIGQARDLISSLLDNCAGKDGQGTIHNATADRLPLALTLTAGTEAGVALAHQETHTLICEDTLLHGETLLIIASSDPEDVSFKLLPNRVCFNLSAHALLHEYTHPLLIFNVKELLAPRSGVSDVQ